MGAVGEAFSQMEQSRQWRVDSEKKRLQLPFAAQEAASDIRFTDSQAAHNEALTDLSRKTEAFNVKLKELDVKRADQEVKELLSTEEGRTAAYNVQKVSNQHLLDLNEENPAKFKAWVGAEMRMKAAQADAATMAIQDERDWRVTDKVYQIMNTKGPNGGLVGVRAAADSLNKEWQDNHDGPLFPKGVTQQDVTGILGTRNNLLYSREYFQKLALQQADPASGLSVQRLLLSLQNREDRINKENAALTDKLEVRERKQAKDNMKEADAAISDGLAAKYGKIEGRPGKERMFTGQGKTIFQNPDLAIVQDTLSSITRQTIGKFGAKFDHLAFVNDMTKAVEVEYDGNDPMGNMTPEMVTQLVRQALGKGSSLDKYMR